MSDTTELHVIGRPVTPHLRCAGLCASKLGGLKVGEGLSWKTTSGILKPSRSVCSLFTEYMYKRFLQYQPRIALSTIQYK
jgi:hypothetical protein